MLLTRTTDTIPLSISFFSIHFQQGTKVRFAGAGNEVAPGKRSDLVFVIDEKPHTRFSREGDDLKVSMSLSLADALDPPPKASRNLTTLDGKKVNIPLPTPSNGQTSIMPGRTTRMANQGMPISKTGGTKRGDLVIVWEVSLPDRLNEEQRKTIRNALSAASS